jgi:hypothetical protein
MDGYMDVYSCVYDFFLSRVYIFDCSPSTMIFTLFLACIDSIISPIPVASSYSSYYMEQDLKIPTCTDSLKAATTLDGVKPPR